MQGEDIIEHINLMASVMCLHFNMQEEDIHDHINDKLSCVYILVCKRMICMSISMVSVVCV